SARYRSAGRSTPRSRRARQRRAAAGTSRPRETISSTRANTSRGVPVSWKTILQNEGFEVVPVLRGLGQIEAVQAVYVDHVKNAK
ncbi:MAG: sirohydrochlorin cobaltochelatase, partial [Clostridia bacterium]|nr:sirohydrochlorin cobaltochelatase [Clostridia bacterium]